MSGGKRLLMLGGGEGWHAQQLRSAANASQWKLSLGTYQTLAAAVDDEGTRVVCDAGDVSTFDAILTRTMPAGTLETVTFRLANLHALEDTAGSPVLVNPPRSLEMAIDKFATLARVAALGYPVPATRIVQSRREALDAFDELGGDCVVKPIFGGEGRGVMRIQQRELAWYAFATLETLGAVAYVQQFINPGGRDTRLLVIGDQVLGFRRSNDRDFRTNVSGGGRCESIRICQSQVDLARHVCGSMNVKFGSVDLLDRRHGPPCVVEVNAIPGWRSSQSVCDVNLAGMIIEMLDNELARRPQAAA